MNLPIHNQAAGCVASLHVHPAKPGAPLCIVSSFEVVMEKGILGNGRYFGRTSRSTGTPSRRQVTLIERERIAEHAAALGLKSIPPGMVRSNIETTGIDLASLLGRRVAIGSAILHFYELRDPCNKMDAICRGLRELMLNGRQGVLAEVVQSGLISVGDAIKVTEEPFQN